MKNIRKNSYIVRVYYKSAGKVKVLVLYRKEKKPNTTFHILYKGKPLRD